MKKKQSRLWLYLLAFLVFCVGAGYQFWTSDYAQRKFVYPWQYGREIHSYSAKYRVDPFLVVAIVKNESGFKASAKSKPGALGLMQIMPETGAWIAKTTDFPNFKDKLLLLPELNIKFGCWYLGELEHEFKGNEILTLAAYNAGRGTVKEWMEDNDWDFYFADPALIPFVDTREYVQKVLWDRSRYQELYKNIKPVS